MLIKNACIENNEELKCIRIEDGKFKEIKKDLEPYAQEEVIDLEGKLILPPFVESHVHLDTCLTAGQPHWNMSGTLFEGIERWEERKEFLTKKRCDGSCKQSHSYAGKSWCSTCSYACRYQ